MAREGEKEMIKTYRFYRKFRIDGQFYEQNIEGKDYEIFLKECFEKSSFVSLRFHEKNNAIKKELEQFPGVLSPSLAMFTEAGKRSSGYYVYCNTCPKVLEIIAKKTSKVFNTYNGENLPDDIAFYRENGTPFLFTYDDVIVLKPLDEDVSTLTSIGRWFEHSQDYHLLKMKYSIDCVPDADTANSIARAILKKVKHPYKKGIKLVETSFDIENNKWHVVFFNEKKGYSFCRIVIDKETAKTEVFYESI